MPSLALLALACALLAGGSAQAAGWPDLGAAPAASVAEKPGPAPGDRAVIVGIERYFAVPRVSGAEQNARDWFTWFTRTRGLPVPNVALLRDAEGTVEKMRRYAAEAARDVAPGGTVWFVFIGHGAPSKDGHDGVLVGADAQQDPDSLYARSLPRAELLATLGAG